MAETEIYVIGSAPDCDIVVDDPHVSSRHCQLTYERGGYLLEDLGSTNGTFVNGVRISEETLVTKGERVTLGRSTLMPWPGAETQSRSESAARPSPPPVPEPPPMPAVPIPKRSPAAEPPQEQFDPPPASSPRESPEPARATPRFTDPESLEPAAGDSRNLAVIVAGSVAGLVVAILLGWALFGGGGGDPRENDSANDDDAPPVNVADNDDPPNDDSDDPDDKDGGTGPKPPPVLPPVKTDPQRAIVWIGHRHAGGEDRQGTGFAVGPNQLLTTGWHAFWLEDGFANEDVTVVAGFGDATAVVTDWELVPIEGDEYGIARLVVEPLEGLEPIDPGTIGPPPKPQTRVDVTGWNGTKTDSTIETVRTTFGAPIVKGQSWKVDDSNENFKTEFAGGPVTIDRRVVGIGGVANNANELRILAVGPALKK